MFIVLDVTELYDVSEVAEYTDKLKQHLPDTVPFVVLANKIDTDPDQSYMAKIKCFQ